MKHLRILIPLITLSFVLAACSSDDDDQQPSGGNTVVNNNKNDASVQPELARLEFPKVKGGNSEVIIHSTKDYGMTYALEWDHNKKAQRWTCFEINAKNRVKNWSRKQWESTSWGGDPFQLDPKVPINEQPPVYNEFSKSYYPGTTNVYYQRGHICASEDRVYSKEANEQTFYMTNMMPQIGKLNEKIWMKMEERVRSWGTQNDTLYICKGGTIDDSFNIIGYTKSGFIVPRYFFMALLAKNQYGYKAIAFIAEHLNEDHSKDNLADYVYSIDDLEKFTGIDFFCNLPDDRERVIEAAQPNDALWGLE